MNGKHTDPAYDLEWGQEYGVIAKAHRRSMDYAQREARRRFVLQVINLLAVVALIGAFFLLLSGAPVEARQRFVQRQVSGGCPNGQCNLKQQAVVVQKVVAQPVVHHAAPVVAAPVYAAPVVAQPNIHTQNNWYSVGQPLVQHSQLVAAARDAVAEQQFKATVQGSFQATVNGAGQALYQQQAAPVYQQPAPQWTPPAEPQPPAQPDAPPTFSMTAPTSLQQNCGECHGSGKAKGGFSLEGMTGDQLWAAIDRIKDGSMPPGNPLSQAAKEAVAKELLSLKP